MKLLIAGDLSLRDRTANMVWNESELANAFSEVKTLVSQCGHAIVNLESPVSDYCIPLLKDGPTLKIGTIVFDIIHYCGFDIVTLANNHLKDYGSRGVEETLSRCKKKDLMVVGAGMNSKDARRPILLQEEGFTLGIINVCEHESSVATYNSAGANPLDFPNLYYDILELRKKADKVMVIIHGGREHYRLPTPRMKREYHLIADYGADVIVNHHQHCFSGYEIYKHKPIFYGLGNFFFDNSKKRDNGWNYGLILQLNIDNAQTDFNIIPFEQCNANPVISVRRFEDMETELEKLNAVIADDKLLFESFENLIEKVKPLYPFLPYGNHYLRALYRRGFLPDFLSKSNKVKLENAISCETHREIILSYLNKHLHNE
jgi:poly-gamma-glutamate synthesis protein (capsule biosynthesis protein)